MEIRPNKFKPRILYPKLLTRSRRVRDVLRITLASLRFAEPLEVRIPPNRTRTEPGSVRVPFGIQKKILRFGSGSVWRTKLTILLRIYE